MPESHKITETPVPGLPRNELIVYTLDYNMSQGPQRIAFEIAGNFQAAVTRAKAYCTAMGYRFITVRPWLVNLDESEKRKSIYNNINDGSSYMPNTAA